MAACVYTVLLPTPGGKVRLRVQTDFNFVRPVWLARAFWEYWADSSPSCWRRKYRTESTLREKENGKIGRSGGRKVDKWLYPDMIQKQHCHLCKDGVAGELYDGRLRIEKNPTIIEVESCPCILQLLTFLGPSGQAAAPVPACYNNRKNWGKFSMTKVHPRRLLISL